MERTAMVEIRTEPRTTGASLGGTGLGQAVHGSATASAPVPSKTPRAARA
ncbi:MAG: hypothetical protein JRM74_01310 [Nitrososphaerota archaeon]|nr:hypothetical protein [Nitrososphaerota archaeon]